MARSVILMPGVPNEPSSVDVPVWRARSAVRVRLRADLSEFAPAQRRLAAYLLERLLEITGADGQASLARTQGEVGDLHIGGRRW